MIVVIPKGGAQKNDRAEATFFAQPRLSPISNAICWMT